MPTARLTRVPQIRRERMSRPKRVGAEQMALGAAAGSRRLAGSVASGSGKRQKRCGERDEQRSARSTTSPPVASVLLSSSRRLSGTRRSGVCAGAAGDAASAISAASGRAWSAPRRRQVEQHIGRCNDQHAALDQQQVAGRDRLDQHRADARPLEHGLDIDGAAEHEAGLDADDRDDA